METTTILPIYHKCDVCDYSSILKANYDRHLQTKKHLKNIEKFNEKIINYDFNADCSHEGLNKNKVVEIAEKFFNITDDVRPEMFNEILQSGIYLDSDVSDVNQLETEYQKNRIIWNGLTKEGKIVEARDMLPYDKLIHYCQFVYIVEKYVSPQTSNSPQTSDIFYATKIYNTLFELKRQYPNKYQFVRNTDRMKREWVRWTQEQYDNDYVYCYMKWFREISKCNNELIGRFVF